MDVRTRIHRLETLSALGDALNAAPTFAEAAPQALERLVALVGLRAGWMFVTTVDAGDTHQGSFRLAAATGLPPALEHDERAPLCFGRCECQNRFRYGRLDRGVNMVTCSRLRDAEGDKQGLVMHASVPLLGQRGPVGILNLAAPGDARFTDETLAFLSVLGRQLGGAFERSRLQEERTEQVRYAATLEERQRLAREMHDSLAQLLFAADLSLSVARDARKPQLHEAAVDQAASSVSSALQELQALVEVLRPPDPATGLHAALLRLTQRTGGSLDVHLDAADVDPPAAIANALYRIAQEATHNVLRHARARNLWLRLSYELGRLGLDVADDGVGLEHTSSAVAASGLGLPGMREHAASVGGALRVSQRPGGGTLVTVEVPWQPAS